MLSQQHEVSRRHYTAHVQGDSKSSKGFFFGGCGQGLEYYGTTLKGTLSTIHDAWLAPPFSSTSCRIGPDSSNSENGLPLRLLVFGVNPGLQSMPTRHRESARGSVVRWGILSCPDCAPGFEIGFHRSHRDRATGISAGTPMERLQRAAARSIRRSDAPSH